MANPKHVEIMRKGAASISKWMGKNPRQTLCLSGADLSGADLSMANLCGIDLEGADLYKVRLHGALLLGTRLNNANLSEADLYRANLAYSFLRDANLSAADLFGADLTGADLTRANLTGANLTDSRIRGVALSQTDFTGTRLTDASLYYINAALVNLTNAKMCGTTCGSCDFSYGVGIDTIQHEGRSYVDYTTLMISFGNAGKQFTPALESFFLSAGVPKQLLDAFPRIFENVDYCSCFVCYGEPDRAFAEKLVRDLKKKDVPCWLYSMDCTPGERVFEEIAHRRREADNMIVLCSVESLIRDGVLKEIEEQIDEDPDKIVPISLDNVWRQSGFVIRRGKREDLKAFLLDRNYADFSNKSKYNESLERLLKGIKRERS